MLKAGSKNGVFYFEILKALSEIITASGLLNSKLNNSAGTYVVLSTSKGTVPNSFVC